MENVSNLFIQEIRLTISMSCRPTNSPIPNKNDLRPQSNWNVIITIYVRDLAELPFETLGI
jgi:hypothetical protein